MTRDSKYRNDHPEIYKWMSYHCFGAHSTRYISDEEKESEKKFYYLTERNEGSCVRYGKQPIFILRREKAKKYLADSGL